MKIKELLSDKSKWTKESIARDKHGCTVIVSNENAVSFCLIGAANKCCVNLTDKTIRYSQLTQIYSKLQDAINRLYPNIKQNDIVAFNDRETTTYEDIMKVVELANV